jgi:iron complex outermembrane receptor protein
VNNSAKQWIALAGLLSVAAPLNAELSSSDLFELSLSELVALKVSASSHRDDSQFSAPIAINSLTAKQLEQSNATSIPEALRLLPGVIVKQVTNGTYTVDVRGYDGVVPANAPPFSTNSGLLVLLDGEPVFNYFTGGVYWPSLGISLQDVATIEVVRGPATAMYGPNAANGVISITSKKPQEPGWTNQVRAATGENGYQDLSWRSDYANDALKVNVSAQDQSRDRTAALYYGFQDQQYQPAEDVLFLNTPFPVEALTPGAYPHVDNSLGEKSFAIHASYSWQDLGTTTVSFSDHDASFHTISLDTAATPYAYLNIDGYSARVVHQYKNVKLEYSKNRRNQDLAGSTILDYEMDIERLHLSGNLNWGDHVLHGYVSHKEVETDSPDFLGPNSGKALKNTAAGLHLDYQLTQNTRAIGAYRLDDFSTDHNNEGSYQFALTYQLNQDNMFWVMHGLSFRSPFVLDSFINVDTVPVANTFSRFRGNEDLDLLELEETQMGWRSQITPEFSVQLDVFYRETSNYSFTDLVNQTIEGINTVSNYTWSNLPTTSEQLGATLVMNWQPAETVNVQGHITAKRTLLDDRQQVAGQAPSYDDEYKGSPDIYGG